MQNCPYTDLVWALGFRSDLCLENDFALQTHLNFQYVTGSLVGLRFLSWWGLAPSPSTIFNKCFLPKGLLCGCQQLTRSSSCFCEASVLLLETDCINACINKFQVLRQRRNKRVLWWGGCLRERGLCEWGPLSWDLNDKHQLFEW